VPLTTSAVAYLRMDQMGNATGLYNLMRNLGGSLGIAFVTTMLSSPRCCCATISSDSPWACSF
jgi:hypothetical protein